MPITLQFVAGGHAHDVLIQYFTHGWATHVDIVWPPNMPGNSERLFGARIKGGVAVRALDYENFSKVARVTLPTSAEQDERFFAFCKAQMGKPYDTAAIMAFATGRNWRAENHWFCSELTECATEHCGFWRPIAAPAHTVTPVDYLNLCSAFAEVVYVR